MTKQKSALIILDGWGIGDHGTGDAIFHARTPHFDRLLATYPNTTLKTFGEFVGLPTGQMGNSEVGHLNIGAGRIVYQDLARINRAVEDGSLAKNPALLASVDYAEKNARPIHLMGLVSRGGVHSSQDHLHALIEFLETTRVPAIYVHAFTDGRDTEPRNAVECMCELEAFLKDKRTKIASMVGRYYSMDRDKRWERVKVAYDLLVHGKGQPVEDFELACRQSYERDLNDEFFLPHVSSKHGATIKSDDAVICFNFRTDRCRQITTALTQLDMPEYGMATMPLHYTTMTRYDEQFRNVHVMFEKDNLKLTMGEVVAMAGRSQLRVAETEKYPHVTFFFSGGREAIFQGEDRRMAHSPKVATYDLQPEMSAREVADLCVDAIVADLSSPDFICLNFANPDMVGHTGVIPAIIKAVEATDEQLGRVVATAQSHGYELIIIADHGNADQCLQSDGTPHTAHTTNPVPCILVSDRYTRLREGILADVAPTLLELMGIEQPAEMTGRSLIDH